MSIPRTILYVAVTLTVVAASVHAWATTEHFEEWWRYGVFFMLVAAAQGLYGPALIKSPRRPVLLLTGVGGNLAIIVLYLVTRTVRVPFFGPQVILQVIFEVERLLLRDSARTGTPALSVANLGGLTSGIAIMYATALLVAV